MKPDSRGLALATVTGLEFRVGWRGSTCHFSSVHSLIRWVTWLIAVACLNATGAAETKPVLLYSLHFQAPGENRYAPDGAYREVLDRLRESFEVRVSSERPSAKSLTGIDMVVLANPNDRAHGTNPPPQHVTARDVRTLGRFVERGGGLIVFGNQEGHNLEVTDLNGLLRRFGLELTNRYHDAKLIAVPRDTPVIGGLRWGFYTGNEVLLASGHQARPTAWVTNDVGQPTLTGKRNEPGVLLATSTPGKGRVVLATDAGWITKNALLELGIGDLTIRGQDNLELFRRLCQWAANRNPANPR